MELEQELVERDCRVDNELQSIAEGIFSVLRKVIEGGR